MDAYLLIGADGGTRTLTTVRSQDFKSLVSGADDGTRTRKPLRARSFKPLAYTSSATSASHDCHFVTSIVSIILMSGH